MKARHGVPLFFVLVIICGCRRDQANPPEASWYPEEILTRAERAGEVAAKAARVTGYLRAKSMAGVLISDPANFAWITGGADNTASRPEFAARVFVAADGRKVVLAPPGSGARLESEDLAGSGFELREIPWSQFSPAVVDAALRELAPAGPCASDAREDLAGLREPLTESEVRKYRWLGQRTAEVTGELCRRIQPGTTERGIEALLAQGLMRHAIRPVSVQVAADVRAQRFGFAPASEKAKVENSVLVSVKAARWGLIVSMARQVHFGPVPREMSQASEAVAVVDAGYWARTLPGAEASAILAGAIEDYARAGYPLEWKRTDQGGAIGYGRDWIATPDSPMVVRSGQAFAWHPFAAGVGVEDTILVMGDRLEVLTEIRHWPVIESKSLGRIYRTPGILVK